MSSKSTEEKIVYFEVEEKESIRIRDIVIPYSLFFRKQQEFIYSGKEKIPFEKRHPLYRTILLNEFRD